MARYALADHVFVCLNGEHLVLLDVKDDRYWALEAATTAGLDSLVGGWPVKAHGERESTESPSAEIASALEVLRGRGLLAATGVSGKDATPVSAILPESELTAEAETAPGTRARGFITFLLASAFAKLALRLWPFARVVQRVSRRKIDRAVKAEPLDAMRARRLVEAFARYRVFMFSSKDECLYDSFALLEFLARYKIYPDWVFGVQTRPFAAHCWVQHGAVVFNDTVEHVSGYTPIMVV